MAGNGRTPLPISGHIRSNVVGYVALFFVLTGGAYAANGSLEGKNTVGSADIIKGQVRSGDIGRNQVKSTDIGKGQVKSGDIADGKVTSADIGDGQVGGADVDESGLDSSVLQQRVSGNCPAGQAIRAVGADGTVTCESDDSGGGGTPSGAAGGDLTGTYPNPTISSGAISGGTGGEISDNTVTDADLAATAQFTGAAAGGDLTGTYPSPTIDADAVGSDEVAPNSLTVEDLGQNSVGTSEVDGTLGEADIQDTLRSISLPLTSFIECQTDSGAFLNFTSGADASPDFSNSATDGEGFTIRFDNDGGNLDEDTEICSQIMVPADFAATGVDPDLRVRWSKDTQTVGGIEQIECGASVNGEALDPADVRTVTLDLVELTESATCSPEIAPLAPQDSLSFYLSVVSPGAINDPVEFHSVEFIYTADQ